MVTHDVGKGRGGKIEDRGCGSDSGEGEERREEEILWNAGVGNFGYDG